ncbi:MAG: extracellular solute-binding protein [Candidatus Hydrogenedentes bacterium]|nr:extracellular solute-binding protein [Candidatus Hydrogenedentota bacterium]
MRKFGYGVALTLLVVVAAIAFVFWPTPPVSVTPSNSNLVQSPSTVAQSVPASHSAIETGSTTGAVSAQLRLGPVPGHETAYREFFGALVAGYNAAQSATVVSLEFVPEEIDQKWNPAIRGQFWEWWTDYAVEHALDLLIVPREVIPELALRKEIVALDPFFESGTVHLDDILPDFRDLARFQGKHYGLPLTFTAYVLVLNNAMLKPGSAGTGRDWSPLLPLDTLSELPPPPSQEVATWDDLEQLMTWSMGTPFAYRRRFAPLIVDFPSDFTWLWLMMAVQEGAKPISHTGRVDLAHEGFRLAFDRLRRWEQAELVYEYPTPFKLKPTDPQFERITGVSDHWLSRIISFEQQRTGLTLADLGPFYRVVPLPSGSSDAILRDSLDVEVWDYTAVIMNRAPDVQLAAWRFLEWVVKSDVLAAVIANPEYPLLPATRFLYDHPILKAAIQENYQRSGAVGALGRYVSLPLVPALREVRRIIDKHFNRAWQGEASLEEALAQAEAEANETIYRATEPKAMGGGGEK